MDEILNLTESVSEGFPSYSCVSVAANDSSMEREHCLGTLLLTRTRMNACANHYSILCAQPHALEAFLADTVKAKCIQDKAY